MAALTPSRERDSPLRIATLIISLVLSLGLFIQSCAVSVGGSISEDLSTGAIERQEAQDLAGGGAFGILAALLWLVAAGFVMAKPKVSVWLFAIAALSCLIGGAAGFTDLFIWAVVSVGFAVMSFFGIRERRKKEEQDRGRYQADVAAAAASISGGSSQPGIAPPSSGQASTPPPPPGPGPQSPGPENSGPQSPR